MKGTKILAAEIRTILMIDKHYKLITLQDINSEIEQKEIEAWHKLIRILTHEIMNSVTPISSLSETMQSMLINKNGSQKILAEIRDDTITDILFSLNTIQKRSESLLIFVENYRRLTRVPKPVMQHVQLKPWLASIENLMREELIRESISLVIHLEMKPSR
jgi:nitrogen fixation/metabolism regulation signal transduction histidine kinase